MTFHFTFHMIHFNKSDLMQPVCFQVNSVCMCGGVNSCICKVTCVCGSVWGEKEQESNVTLTLHSHIPVTNVKYFKRPCSDINCNHVLHPDGLHQGLLIMKGGSATLENPDADPTAYDHDLLFNVQDDFEVGGGTDTAAYKKLTRSYSRLPQHLKALLPHRKEFDVAIRNFRCLVDDGRHLACTEDGVDNLFACPICGDAETAKLVADGTASKCPCLYNMNCQALFLMLKCSQWV